MKKQDIRDEIKRLEQRKQDSADDYHDGNIEYLKRRLPLKQ